VRLAGYKLVSLLSFRGRKGDAAARTLVSASIWRDSVEGKSGTYGVSAQTVRNYVEDQGLSVIGNVLEEVRGISAKMLEGARRIDLSLDWTGIRYYGKYVEGLGSGDEGYPWNYATATTKYRGRILLLAFSPYVRGMSEAGIVGSPIEQVDFRLIVSRRRGPEYVARATNLELPGRDVLRLYDRIRAPIETSYRDIKSFLLFTSSTKRVFRLFAFLLAALIYSFSTIFRGSLRREEFRLLLALILIRGMVEVEVDPIEPFSGDHHACHDPYLRDPYLRR